MSSAWFEISNDGWRRIHASRPLGLLLCEGLQNALDEDVTRVTVSVTDAGVVIEDDGVRGFVDERLVYTIFLTAKAESPGARGRQGRGLKELISAMDAAELETVGFTVRFDAQGRHVESNTRKKGTRLCLHRRIATDELGSALSWLRLTIPPAGTVVEINGQSVAPPPLFATLPDCHLDTVIVRDGSERVEERVTTVRLFDRRDRTETPHLFEMGLPLSASPTPWHVDVGQRVPRAAGLPAVTPEFRRALLATLFESMVPGALPEGELNDAWVLEVLSQPAVSDAALRTWARRRFAERTVLPSTAADDERARQTGARVLEANAVAAPVVENLRRVMESSHAWSARQAQRAEEVRALAPREEAVLSFYRHLAKKILGEPITIRLVRRPPSADGIVEDATFLRERNELSINLLGHLDLAHPLAPTSLGILLHELAHTAEASHDAAFVARLGELSGRAAALFAREGPELCSRFGLVAEEGVTPAEKRGR
jgi:hypothetical protein